MMRQTVNAVAQGLSRFANKGSAFHQSALLVVLALFNTLIQAFCFLLMFQKIGPDTFGQYRSFLSFAAFSGLSHLGIADGFFLEWLIHKKKPQLGDFFSICLLTLLLSMVVFFLDRPLEVRVLLILYMLMANLAFCLHGAFVVAGRYHSALIFNLFVQSVLVGVMLMLPGVGLLTIIAAGLLAQVAGVIWLSVVAWKRMLIDAGNAFPTFKELKLLFMKGFPVLLIGFFFLSIFNLDKILLIDNFDATDFGRYAFATSLTSIGVGVLSAPVNLLFKKINGLSEQTIAGNYQKMFSILWVFGIGAFAMVPLVFWVLFQFTDNYKSTQPFAQSWSAVLFPLLALQLLLANLYKKFSLQSRFVWAASVAVLVIIAAIFFCRSRIDGLLLLPLLIAQILVILMIVLERILISYENVFALGHNTRVLMILFFNFIFWIIHVY